MGFGPRIFVLQILITAQIQFRTGSFYLAIIHLNGLLSSKEQVIKSTWNKFKWYLSSLQPSPFRRCEILRVLWQQEESVLNCSQVHENLKP